MQSYPATSHSQLLILQILSQVDKKIQELDLIKMAPKYAQNGFMQELKIKFDATFSNPQKRTLLRQQQLHNVPHISKDNLMPKDLSSQQSHNNPQNRSIGRSSMGKKFSTGSKRPSLSLTAQLRNSSIVKPSIKNVSVLKEKRNECKQLSQQEIIPDEEIDHCRQLTEIRLKYEGELKRMQMMREKSFQQKSQIFTTLQVENGSITHDYDGEHLTSLVPDQKIRHYTLKVGIGAHKRRLEDLNFEPVLAKVETQRYSKEKDYTREIEAMELPLFPLAKYQTSRGHNYKLDQYKKRYARGFSRFDKPNQTIQYTTITSQAEDHFAQQKHLKDTVELEKSQLLKSSRVMRRLALPKLKGNYKVLDRYQQA